MKEASKMENPTKDRELRGQKSGGRIRLHHPGLVLLCCRQSSLAAAGRKALRPSRDTDSAWLGCRSLLRALAEQELVGSAESAALLVSERRVRSAGEPVGPGPCPR